MPKRSRRDIRFWETRATRTTARTDICPHCHKEVGHADCQREAPHFAQQQLYMLAVEEATTNTDLYDERNITLEVSTDDQFKQSRDQSCRRWRKFGPGTSAQLAKAFCDATECTPIPPQPDHTGLATLFHLPNEPHDC
jgi:hypothetical protein